MVMVPFPQMDPNRRARQTIPVQIPAKAIGTTPFQEKLCGEKHRYEPEKALHFPVAWFTIMAALEGCKDGGGVTA